MRTTFAPQGVPIATGCIDPLPGCSQVAVFHSAFVLPQYRKQKFGEQAHQARLQVATSMLYDYGLVTVDRTNEAQVKILVQNGWSHLDTFTSRKTGHTLFIFGRSFQE